MLEEEEAATPGASGLLREAEDILSQLAALKRLLREPYWAAKGRQI